MQRLRFTLFALLIASASSSVLMCAPFTSSGVANEADGDGASDESSSSKDATPSCAPNPSFDTDAKNCGRCGRDCGGGACVNAMCKPYVISDSAPGSWYIAVDDTNVYWTSQAGESNPTGDGHVRKAAKLGGSGTVEVFPAQQSWDVAVVNGLLYVSAFDINKEVPALVAVPVTGGAPSVVLSFSGGVDLAQHKGVLFMTSQPNGIYEISSPTAVRGLGGGNLVDDEGIGVDDSYIYWSDHQTNAGVINRMTRDGNDKQVLEGNEPGARRIAVDDQAIYWTLSASATVRRREKATGKRTEIADGVSLGSILLDLDGSHLYLAKDAKQQVVRVDKIDGKNPVVLGDETDGLKLPTGLAQDKDAIYVTDRNAGKVFRVVK